MEMDFNNIYHLQNLRVLNIIIIIVHAQARLRETMPSPLQKRGASLRYLKASAWLQVVGVAIRVSRGFPPESQR